MYALLLVIEWRTAGVHGVGRRILVGAFLAGMGVLALGVGFEVWLKMLGLPMPVCEEGSPVINDVGVEAAAVLGLTLASIAGPALRLVPLAELPLSTIAASVALATWMLPALPALGWLPTSIGGGAPLALLLYAACGCFSARARGAGRRRSSDSRRTSPSAWGEAWRLEPCRRGGMIR